LSKKKWKVVFTKHALEDLKTLDGSLRGPVGKAIDKVSANPLPQSEGGYGKPLGNKAGMDLAGLLKIKLKKSGVRIVYSIKRSDEEMTIVIIGVRANDEVYAEASKRMVHESE